jgi:hypothetical protein
MNEWLLAGTNRAAPHVGKCVGLAVGAQADHSESLAPLAYRLSAGRSSADGAGAAP